jgi:hypothetical protein
MRAWWLLLQRFLALERMAGSVTSTTAMGAAGRQAARQWPGQENR